METLTTEETIQKQNYHLQFFGVGAEYFAIMIVNWLLTVVTLGLYYPWARAKKLRYIYGNTALNNERFYFSGTGKEMFIGFIKTILFYLVVFGTYMLILLIFKLPIIAILFLYLAIFAIVPFVIHGAWRYNMSRTSYRGIRFGYRGNRNELIGKFYKGVFFTIITLGIYAAWLQMDIRRYTHKNIRYGNVSFLNNADGTDWLILNLKGYFLSLLTLGIYVFWWRSESFAYYYDNLSAHKNEQSIKFKSIATGGNFFELLVVNFLIVIFTLGFGKAWADMRTIKFVCDNVKMEGDINIDEIQQTEDEYTDAFGADAMEFFDIDTA